MRPEDVYELVNAGDPRISPDASRVAYTVDRGRPGGERVHVRDLGRANQRLDRGAPLHVGREARLRPALVTDGKWLAFTSTRGEDKAPAALYVLRRRAVKVASSPT